MLPGCSDEGTRSVRRHLVAAVAIPYHLFDDEIFPFTFFKKTGNVMNSREVPRNENFGEGIAATLSFAQLGSQSHDCCLCFRELAEEGKKLEETFHGFVCVSGGSHNAKLRSQRFHMEIHHWHL